MDLSKITSFPSSNLELLLDGNRLRVKFGIDPTRDRIHLGHLVPIRLVRQLQEMGHEIHIVLGTFTACLGDPSGQDKTRPFIDSKMCDKNAESIIRQVEALLMPGLSIYRNNEWFDTMSVPFLLTKLAGRFTVAKMMSRDGFKQRVSIGLHELIVPLLQGWDSVILKADIEIGGTDQLFNFSVTRELQAEEGQKPETCLMTPIISGTDGRKMSKSFDNCIFLDESPEEIFGKVMSISDDVMEEWIPLLTNGIAELHPMQRKKALAFEIIKQISGAESAEIGMRHFENVIQNKQISESDLVTCGCGTLLDIVSITQNISRTKARKLIADGAVKIDGVKNHQFDIFISKGIIRVGKLGVIMVSSDISINQFISSE